MEQKNKLHFKLLTPTETKIDKDIDYVVLPQIDGDITIMNGHFPIVSLFREGKIKIVTNNNEEIYNVLSGMAKSDGKHVVVTTRTLQEDIVATNSELS